jgi:hypothetical protein
VCVCVMHFSYCLICSVGDSLLKHPPTMNSASLSCEWFTMTDDNVVKPIHTVRSSGQSSWLEIQRSRVRFPPLSDFLRSSVSGTGYTQPREYN